jgi:hypothetical protein
MAATHFRTAHRTCREWLGNGQTYVIPRFQRDDPWDEAQCKPSPLTVCA